MGPLSATTATWEDDTARINIKFLNDKVIGSEVRIGPWARSRTTATPPGVVTVTDPFPAFSRSMEPLIAEIERKQLDVKGTIDLAGRLEALGATLETEEANCYLMYDIGHFSARGHAIIGELPFRSFDEAGWLP